jgi:hypothetical protein
MRIKPWSPLYLTAFASVAVGLGALSLGGQELFFDSPAEPPASGAVALPPGAGAPSIVATAEFAPGEVPPPGPSSGGITVFAEPSHIHGPHIQGIAEVRPVVAGGGITLFAQHPHVEGVDEETRQLHADDQAHELTTRQLLEKLRNAETDDDRSDVIEQLSQTVAAQFETRQQIRAKEVAALEARIEKLREHHDKREEAKADIVKARVEQLARQAEGLGWSDGGEHAEFHFQSANPIAAPTAPRAINLRSR